MRLLTRRRTRRSGLTILELSISMVVYVVFAGSLLLLMLGSRRAEDAVAQRLVVAHEAMRAMDMLRLDLQRSGWTTVAGVEWPVIEDGGANTTEWAFFDHAVPHQDGDDPICRPCTMRLPEDADADGWPDVNGSELEWGNDAVAWIAVPGDDGRNSLVRRTSAGGQRVLSDRLRWIVFEDPEDTGYTIPLDAMRVRMGFRVDDPEGTYTVEETIALRNGGLSE